jgi:hypothetical protein
MEAVCSSENFVFTCNSTLGYNLHYQHRTSTEFSEPSCVLLKEIRWAASVRVWAVNSEFYIEKEKSNLYTKGMEQNATKLFT